jgi:hypothetical protein
LVVLVEARLYRTWVTKIIDMLRTTEIPYLITQREAALLSLGRVRSPVGRELGRVAEDGCTPRASTDRTCRFPASGSSSSGFAARHREWIAIADNKPGHEIEHPMAVVILGGLVTSTILNLFLMPSLYLAFGRGRGAGDRLEEFDRVPAMAVGGTSKVPT